MRHSRDIVEVLSGARRDWRARGLRCLLRCGEPLYGQVVGIRNWMFDNHWRRSRRADVPVISVGNITTGGTGKTPVVRWLVEQLRLLGNRPGIVSRGYRAQRFGPSTDRQNDEYYELKFHLPEVPHIQNPDRVTATEQLVSQGVDVVVLDDGFQHRRLRRDLDIVLIDATRPFGFDHLLPRGLLREPLHAIRRADFVIITRSQQVAPEQIDSIMGRIEQVAPGTKIAQLGFHPVAWLDTSGHRHPLDDLRSQPVLGFCGIGNPHGFELYLRELCDDLRGIQTFSDHHAFTPSDWSQLIDRARQSGASALACTHKDLVKITEWPESTVPVYALEIQADLGAFERLLIERIQLAVSRAEVPDSKTTP